METRTRQAVDPEAQLLLLEYTTPNSEQEQQRDRTHEHRGGLFSRLAVIQQWRCDATSFARLFALLRTIFFPCSRTGPERVQLRGVRGNGEWKVTKLLLFALMLFAVLGFWWFSLELAYGRGVLRSREPDQRDSSSGGSIPRLIHQVYFGVDGRRMEEVHKEWPIAAKQWRLVHKASEITFGADHRPSLIELGARPTPETVSGEPASNPRAANAAPDDSWRYLLWDLPAVEVLIRDRYPALWDTFQAYPHWVQRADVARYVILHAYGGVYSDLDILPARAFDPILSQRPAAIMASVPSTSLASAVTPDLMAFAAGHPFLQQILGNVPGRASSWATWLLMTLIPYVGIMYSTGPIFLTQQFLAFVDKTGWPAASLVLLGPEYYSDRIGPKVLVRHTSGSSWHTRDAQLLKEVSRVLRLTQRRFFHPLSTWGEAWCGGHFSAGGCSACGSKPQWCNGECVWQGSDLDSVANNVVGGTCVDGSPPRAVAWFVVVFCTVLAGMAFYRIATSVWVRQRLQTFRFWRGKNGWCRPQSSRVSE